MQFSFCTNENAKRIILCILPLFTILGLIVLSIAYAVEFSGKGLSGADAILLKQGIIFLVGWISLFIVSYVPYSLYKKTNYSNSNCHSRFHAASFHSRSCSNEK